MKLRNKKTGEIVAIDYISVKRDAFDIVDGNTGKELAKNVGTMPLCYLTIEELCADFEDYKPAEPLIKDERVRKAVRAWAEANDIERVWHECASIWLRGNGLQIEMENGIVDLEQGNYSIDELCGEEE